MIKKEEFRIYITISSLVFIFALVNGYLSAVNSPERARIIIESFFNNLDFTRNFGPFQIFMFIILNNALKAFLVILFGFIFAIVPLVFLYVNGDLIGLILGVFQQENGLHRIVLGLLPHGIFEIPAIILATSYGIWLGHCFYRRIRYKQPFRVHFLFALKKYFLVIFPLLLLAAAIESFVTPIIMEYIFTR